MSWAKLTSGAGVNAAIRKAVRVEQECGLGWYGATDAVADWLDVSPQLIRARDKDEITGKPNKHADLEDRCWRFLEYVAQRQRAWLDRLDKDIEQRRDALQLTLPLEANVHAQSRGSVGSAANRVARAEGELVRAHRAMADFRRARAKKT